MSHGLVRLFSTDAAEVSLDPAVPFALPAGALKEVSVRLRPEQQGRKQYLVHAVAAPFSPARGDRPGFCSILRRNLTGGAGQELAD